MEDKILINPRPSPCLANVGLFIRPKFWTIPLRTKSLPVSSSSHLEDHLHTWKTYAPSRSSSLRWISHVLREAQLVGYYSFSMRAHLTWNRILLPISRAQLALQGSLLRYFVPWESNKFYPPSDKESRPLCKSIFLTPSSEKIIFSIEVTPHHCIEDNMPYMKHLEHGLLIFGVSHIH